MSGWCSACETYVAPELLPEPGEWREGAGTPRRLAKQEVVRLAKTVAKTLSGPGWPEKQVPLRRDMTPRSWKRHELKVEGQTPLGYDIVTTSDRPAGDSGPSTGTMAEEVPF